MCVMYTMIASKLEIWSLLLPSLFDLSEIDVTHDHNWDKNAILICIVRHCLTLCIDQGSPVFGLTGKWKFHIDSSSHAGQ